MDTWWGCFGGLLSNLIRLVQIAAMPPQQRPIIFSDPWYYVQLVILSGLGGIFVYLYEASGVTLTSFLAVNIGASAPIIAQNLLAAAPPLTRKTD